MIRAGALFSRPIFNRNGAFFWLFHFVVKVRYTFFLVALLLGAGRRDAVALLIWVLVTTLTVLLHELGHALAARRFGCAASIELNSFGGLTSWSGCPQGWKTRLLVSLAGPGIGFAVAPLVLLIPFGDAGGAVAHYATLFIHDLLWSLVVWGVFNLLPILPLDGGAALEAILDRRIGADRSRHTTRVVSCWVGGVTAFVCLAMELTWAGVLCAMLTYNNLLLLRGARGMRIVG